MNFGLGASLDQWDALLNAMLEKGYTKADLLAAGLVVSNQKGRIYDKFRNRLMFPVIDVKGDRTALGKSRFSISMTNWITPPPW